MTTLLQPGDKFRFMGLGDADDRTLTVYSVAVTGDLTVRIDLDHDPEDPITFDQSFASIPYSEALLMVNEGIWKEIP